MDTKKHKPLPKGFSLIECTFILGILGCLLGAGLPYCRSLLMRQERQHIFEQLLHALDYAKQEAYRLQVDFTLCPTSTGKKCASTGNWSSGFILINSASLLQPVFYSGKLRYGSLYYAGFGEAITLKPNGTTINVGTFTYSPHHGDLHEIQQLIVNRAARTYYHP